MAAPVQQQIGQPPQYVQQQPVQQQPGQLIQQAQFVQQPQIVQQPQTVQQVQVVQPTVTREGCCNPHGKALSLNFSPVQLGLGILMILSGVAGVVFGIVGIFTTRHVYYGYSFYHIYYNPTAWLGANIWGGMFYFFCGVFALVTRSKPKNIHLMNTFYAFSLISLGVSLPHIGFSIAYLGIPSVHYTIWFNILSIVLGIIGFAFSLTFVVFLSKDIYCKTTLGTGQAVQYHRTNQVVTLQPHLNQPVFVPAYQPVQAINQPVQTIYTQTALPGQFVAPVVATQAQTSNTKPEPVKSADGSL